MTIKDKIKRIAIIGLGLIGGSLAKALKVNQYYVLGISRKKETVQSALSAFAIDEGSIELDKEALNNAHIAIYLYFKRMLCLLYIVAGLANNVEQFLCIPAVV